MQQLKFKILKWLVGENRDGSTSVTDRGLTERFKAFIFLVQPLEGTFPHGIELERPLYTQMRGSLITAMIPHPLMMENLEIVVPLESFGGPLTDAAIDYWQGMNYSDAQKIGIFEVYQFSYEPTPAMLTMLAEMTRGKAASVPESFIQEKTN